MVFVLFGALFSIRTLALCLQGDQISERESKTEEPGLEKNKGREKNKGDDLKKKKRSDLSRDLHGFPKPNSEPQGVQYWRPVR